MKKKFWKCAYFDYVNDDLTRMTLCHNPDSGYYECVCDRVFQESSCPFYKKGDKSFMLNLNESELKLIDDFKERMRVEINEREDEERALREYLKERYEQQ